MRRLRIISNAASAASAQPLRPFLIERYEGWELPKSLSSSDCESLPMAELLSHADEEGKRLWETLSLGYTDQPGSSFLRKEIAAQEFNTIAESQLNVCAPQEGIYLAMRALLSPGDHVVATMPCYQSLSEVARSVGCTISPWRPEGLVAGEVGGRPRFDPASLRQLLRKGQTKLVVANWPHNPTGALPTAAELQEVVEDCRTSGAWLFIDEIYKGLEHGGEKKRLPSAADLYTKGISLGGVSKTLGLPGLRVGWLASKDAAFLRRVAELKDYTSICPPAPSEVLAFIALRARTPLTERCRAIVAEGLTELRLFMAEHSEHLEWCEPTAGTFAFPRLHPASASAGAYCAALRQRAGLNLIPSSLFEECDDNRVRVTYGRRDLPGLLALWGADLRAHGLSCE